MQKSANNLFIDADSLGLLFAFSLLCNDEVLKLSANFFQEDMKAKVRAAIGRPDYNATWLNSKSFTVPCIFMDDFLRSLTSIRRVVDVNNLRERDPSNISPLQSFCSTQQLV